MSIALLCDSFGALGGVAQIVEDLAVEYARAGHRVAIVSNPHRNTSIVRHQNPDIQQVLLELPRSKPLTWRHPERLWRARSAADLDAFIRRWGPDVVNIHGGLRDRFPPVVKACMQTGVPIVQSFHLVPELLAHNPEDTRMRSFAGMALRAASAITFPSMAVKDGFQQIWPEVERARIIRGGVNVEDAARATPFGRDRPYIFSASRLDLRHKAVDVVIEAFRLIASEFAALDLLIAGDGPHRSQIEEMIAASRLEARVHLLSSLPHSELWSLYKGALLFVMLSRMAEGLPLVFFEAMACGIPAIGTKNGGTPELVVHDETGLLLKSNQATEAAAAMRSLLANPVRRKQMGRQAYQLAKNYDWRAVAARYLTLYKELLASRGQ